MSLGSSDTTTLAEQQSVSASSISIKIPPFWTERVSTWFSIVEAQFELGRITRDATKCSHVIAHLDPKYVAEIEDILEDPSAEGTYEELKNALIKRLSDSSGTLNSRRS